MGRYIRLVLAGLAVVVLMLGSVACTDSKKADPTAAAPTSTGAAAALETVGPPAVINGNVFTSVQHGYRLQFPEGWQADENFAVTPEFALDAFLGPQGDASVQPSISVSCAPATQTPADGFLDLKRQFAQRFAKDHNVQESTVKLGGGDAMQLVFEQVSGTVTLKKTELHQYSHRCGWSVTLTADPSKNYDAAFDQVLQSFQFSMPQGSN